MYCIMEGNPADGFKIHGPFASAEWANTWGDGSLKDSTWWVMDLLPIHFKAMEDPLYGGSQEE